MVATDGTYDAQLAQALGFMQQQQFAPAERLLAQVLARDPAHFDALFLAGVTRICTGRDAEGERLVGEALRVAPEAAFYDYKDGLLRQQQFYSRAESLMTQYLEYRAAREIDTFVISYPKCGRTWVRALLGRVLVRHFGMDEKKILEVLELTSRLPGRRRVEFSHDDYPHWKPREAIVTDKRAYAGKSVVFLARDPRDVMVSSYFEYMRRDGRKHANDLQFNGTLPDFLRHRIGGVANVIAFYNAWARQRHVPKAFLMLTYEELRASPAPALRRLLDFAGYAEVPDAAVAEAVDYCRFENMKRMERENTLGSVRLRAPDVNDPEAFKVRKGKVGGYRDYLDPANIAWLDETIAAGLDDYFACYKGASSARR